MSDSAAIETRVLTKHYGRTVALDDCTITVPSGRISALVGPNGAGKSTLLHILAGLRRATSGEAYIFGRAPVQDPAFLAGVGFLAQEIPLYRRFSAADHIKIGAHVNSRWDASWARSQISELDISLDRPVGKLSGGQRAQVALTLALAKRPRLLLLDEPVAALDPLARRHFLGALASSVADHDVTVLLSSHLVSDLERVCDHLVLLAASTPQVCDDIDTVLAEHKLLVGPAIDTTAIERDHTVVQRESTDRQVTMLVRLHGPFFDPRWEVHNVALEEIVLAYMGLAAERAHCERDAIGAAR